MIGQIQKITNTKCNTYNDLNTQPPVNAYALQKPVKNENLHKVYPTKGYINKKKRKNVFILCKKWKKKKNDDKKRDGWPMHLQVVAQVEHRCRDQGLLLRFVAGVLPPMPQGPSLAHVGHVIDTVTQHTALLYSGCRLQPPGSECCGGAPSQRHRRAHNSFSRALGKFHLLPSLGATAG